MTIAAELKRIIDAKAAIKAAIIEKGVDVPDTEKLDIYYEYIDQITGGSSWDPSNPTLDGLKDAIKNGETIQPGTEIPDIFNGKDNPLIVAQNLDSSNNSAYGGAEGVILVRKYIDPESARFGSGSTDSVYGNSAIYKYLNGDYLDNCSDSLRQIISELSVPVSDGSSITQVSGKFHLMSGIEIGSTYNTGEGFMWDLWKTKTGLASANNGSNDGRVMTNASGSKFYWWVRSRQASNKVWCTTSTGAFTNPAPTTNYGVLPICFISK